jgi:phosphate transport system substrate-binding protein
MWQQEKKDSVIVNLALSLALATTPLVANLFVLAPAQAQSTSDVTTFPLPQTVEDGTKVRIDGSTSLVMINQSLKDTFEKQFSGTQVEVGVNGADAALKALLEGKIDIAAIARDLTPAEKAQGLEKVLLHREKIAIIVGANNPFQGSQN